MDSSETMGRMLHEDCAQRSFVALGDAENNLFMLSHRSFDVPVEHSIHGCPALSPIPQAVDKLGQRSVGVVRKDGPMEFSVQSTVFDAAAAVSGGAKALQQNPKIANGLRRDHPNCGNGRLWFQKAARLRQLDRFIFLKRADAGAAVGNIRNKSL
jgi:hypothetical protein